MRPDCTFEIVSNVQKRTYDNFAR